MRYRFMGGGKIIMLIYWVSGMGGYVLWFFGLVGARGGRIIRITGYSNYRSFRLQNNKKRSFDYIQTKDHSNYRSFELLIIRTTDHSDYRSFRLQIIQTTG